MKQCVVKANWEEEAKNEEEEEVEEKEVERGGGGGRRRRQCAQMGPLKGTRVPLGDLLAQMGRGE